MPATRPARLYILSKKEREKTMIGGEQSTLEPKVSIEEVMQEEKRLLFDRFSRKDAVELGKIMLDKMEELNMTFSFVIKLNGLVVFQYLPEGTGQFNLLWMEKKIHTVELLGRSTMGLWVGLDSRGVKRDNSQLLPSSDIVLCGGGFPIKLKDGEVVGAVATSGPGDQNDHYFGVECLDELLRRKESRAE